MVCCPSAYIPPYPSRDCRDSPVTARLYPSVSRYAARATGSKTYPPRCFRQLRRGLHRRLTRSDLTAEFINRHPRVRPGIPCHGILSRHRQHHGTHSQSNHYSIYHIHGIIHFNFERYFNRRRGRDGIASRLPSPSR